MGFNMTKQKEEYEQVSINQAFEWVKTKHWNLRTFAEWCKVKGTEDYQSGYDAGYEAGYDCGLISERDVHY